MTIDVFDTLARHIPEIAHEWTHLTTRELRLAAPDAPCRDALLSVLGGLLDMARSPSRATVTALVEQATADGVCQRAAGVPDHSLLTEYTLLREAVWRTARRHGAQLTELSAMLPLDLAVSTASRAALVGYYRQELDASGRIDEAVEKILREVLALPLDRLGDGARAPSPRRPPQSH
jgi:hypothetical protein